MLRKTKRIPQIESLDDRVLLDASGLIDLEVFIDDNTTASEILTEGSGMSYSIQIRNNGLNATTAATGVRIGIDALGLVPDEVTVSGQYEMGDDGSILLLDPIEAGGEVYINYTATVQAIDVGHVSFASAVLAADQCDVDSVPDDFSGEDDADRVDTEYRAPQPAPSELLDVDGDGVVEIGAEIPASIPQLSTVNNWEDLDVTSGPVYYRGYGEWEVISLETTGGVIRVFDTNYQLIGEQTAGQIGAFELPGPDIGVSGEYFVQISGDNVIASVNVEIIDVTQLPVGMNNIVVATEADDNVRVALGQNYHLVWINEQSLEILSASNPLHIGGAQGSNSITVHSTHLDDTASVLGTNGEIHSSAYDVYVYGFQDMTFEGAGGNDYGSLYGSNGDDFYSNLPQDSTMTTPDATMRMTGFDRVDGFGRGGNDYAVLYGTTGENQFLSNEDYAWMRGESHVGYAKGFDRVDALARGGGVATLNGTLDDDTHISTANYAMLVTDQMKVYTKGFQAVEVDGRGGNDVAHLHDLAIEDAFNDLEDIATLERADRTELFLSDFLHVVS